MSNTNNDKDIEAPQQTLADALPSEIERCQQLLVDYDIDALLGYTQGICPEKHAALIALVAERNALKQRVAELESQEFTLPSDPFRDPDRDLRERLVCAALTGILAHEGRDREFDCVMDDAIWMAGKALAAMRKGEA